MAMRLETTRRIPVDASAGALFADVDETSPTCVGAFLDCLAELSTDEWDTLSAQPLVETHIVAILEATIADRQLQIDAWFVIDAVETLAFLANSSIRARLTAERATLAVLARRWLAPRDHSALLAPFSALLVARAV